MSLLIGLLNTVKHDFNLKRKSVKNATIVLFVAYLLGQGGAFIVQLISKLQGNSELTGILVILVSLFSFAYQFSDLGNSTFVVRRLALGEFSNVKKYMAIRARVAFVICVVFALYTTFFLKIDVDYVTPYLLMLPFLGWLFGSVLIGVAEWKGAYNIVALFSGTAWVMFSFLLSFYLWLPEQYYLLIGMSVSIVLLLFIFKVRTIIGKEYFIGSKVSENAVLPFVLQFILPQIGGQVWGRSILFIVASSYGLASLGVFGLVKYLQVFFTLIIGFVTRPKLRDYINRVTEENRSFDVFELIKHYKVAVLLSFLGPVLYILTLVYEAFYEKEILDGWLLILCIIPFSVLSQASLQINQLVMTAKLQLLLSYIGLSLNIIVFLLLFRRNLIVAVLMGEIIQYLWNVSSHYIFHNKRKEK